MQKVVYSGDLKSDHSKSRHSGNADFLKMRFQMVHLSKGHAIANIWKLDHLKSGHFGQYFKWFMTKWRPFLWISNRRTLLVKLLAYSNMTLLIYYLARLQNDTVVTSRCVQFTLGDKREVLPVGRECPTCDGKREYARGKRLLCYGIAKCIREIVSHTGKL